jgi:hypothetical protein
MLDPNAIVSAIPMAEIGFKPKYPLKSLLAAVDESDSPAV